jgi:NNP family nitrate/nitrite transporter-like MFS transporter
MATLAMGLSFTAWGLFAPLAPEFRDLYGLSATETAVLVAVPVLLGALGRIPLGLLTDRFGARRVFPALMLCLVFPLGAAGFADSYGTLLVVAFFLGLGGASFAVGVPLVSRIFPDTHQGIALGLYGLGNGGTAIAGQLAPVLSDRAGRDTVFWALIPVMLVAAIGFWLLVRDAPGSRSGSAIGSQLRVFRQARAWVLGLFYFLTFGGFIALSVYLPTYLVDTHALERAAAASRASLFVLLAVLARPLGGCYRIDGGPCRC